MTASKLTACRFSGSTNLVPILNLGSQALTGVFPSASEPDPSSGPLDLIWCPDSGLVQLGHSFSLEEMYGDNYGYRSGLNSSMVRHLESKALYLSRLSRLNSRERCLDIGSNDGTFLNKIRELTGAQCVGIDPTISKYQSYYHPDIQTIASFFDPNKVRNGQKYKLVTSIAMFYDLEDPSEFITGVKSLLTDDGLWHFEQSYMPSMLRTNSYDTICHEHLEFYSFSVIKKYLEAHGLQVIDVVMNTINGGSFAVTAALSTSNAYHPNKPHTEWLLRQEQIMALDTLEPYRLFEARVFQHRASLMQLLVDLKNSGKKVIGYGASTKGNVLLQFCGITSELLPCIADVNPYKYGRETPGTRIPIVSEETAKQCNPDYMLILPWHFRDNIIQREQEYLANGGKLIFPLPQIEII